MCCLHLVLGIAGVQGQAESDDWPCDHQVFCNPGEEGILHTVQMSGLFNDSKTFVDMQMNYDTSPVLFHSVVISKKLKVIIFGTSNGSVRVYLWPFTSTTKESLEYIDVAIHQVFP